MKILNMGSLNIDYVYNVYHIILPGETENTTARNVFLGGKGMKIVLNHSPFNEKLDDCDLEKVSIFILNEVEGEQLTGSNETKGILVELKEKFPHAEIVLTLGREGAVPSIPFKVEVERALMNMFI